MSDHYLASGYVDGSVRLFELPSSRHIATFHPDLNRAHLGLFSRSISGLFLEASTLVFASQAGDIEVASTDEDVDDRGISRLARVGNLVEDGVLVDFTGKGSYWVGLFSGVPDRSFRVWSFNEDEVALLFVGGNLMNPNAVIGWRMLTDFPSVVGRVRVVEDRSYQDGVVAVVGCSSSFIQTAEVSGEGMALEEHSLGGMVAVGSVDLCEGNLMVVESMTGLAKVHQLRTMEEVCRFSTGGAVHGGSIAGGLNWGYVVVCRGNRIKVWDVRTGEYLFTMRERVGGNLVAVSQQYAAVWAANTGLHLWNFME